MTIAEGQDLQGQRDINQQVQGETQQSHGQRRRAKTRERRCGTCGEPGHNSRTCQGDREVSIE